MLQVLLGLDDTAGTVYKAMLAGPAADVHVLSARTGLTESQVHVALKELAALELVRANSTHGKWEPASPELGLAAIVRRHEADLARRQHEIAAAYAGAATAYAAAYPASSHIERLEDLQSIDALAKKLIRNAETELQITVTSHQPSCGWPASSLLDQPGLAPGVKVLALYHDRTGQDPAAMALAVKLAGPGSQARMTPDLPPVLVISDRQAALIPIDPARPANGALGIREPAIVNALIAMFGNAWGSAAPLDATNPANGTHAVSGDEKALLRLLLAGLTDEAAARRLGISVRTARRQVAVLMEKLGASSRFQAGHRAAQRGWL